MKLITTQLFSEGEDRAPNTFFFQGGISSRLISFLCGEVMVISPRNVYVVEWSNSTDTPFIGNALNMMYFHNHGTLCEDQGLL